MQADERFFRRERHLRRRERADEREALAERAARVEVGRERDSSARVDERACGRHRAVQEERARREEDTGDVARGERDDSCRSGRLEVIHRARAELDRERDRTRLGELVAVQAEREAGIGAGAQVPARLLGVERSALEEHVRCLGETGCLGQHLVEQEVDVRIAPLLGELGRNRVCAEPGGNAPRSANRAELRELRLTVEPVPGLRLERRRPRTEHPADVLVERSRETVLAGGTRGSNRREDAAAAGVQLLVRRTSRAQRELLDPVAREARVRVAVDEARDRGEAAPVELLDVAAERAEVAHAPRRRDAPVLAEHVGVRRDLDLAQRRAPERRAASRRRRDLREVADEERAHDGVIDGRSSACSPAAASASS